MSVLAGGLIGGSTGGGVPVAKSKGEKRVETIVIAVWGKAKSEYMNEDRAAFELIE